MPNCRAKQVFDYGGRLITPGQMVDVEDRFVKVLVAVGRIYPPEAKPAEHKPAEAPPSGEYSTAAIAASPEQKAPRPRRRESLVGNRKATGGAPAARGG